MITMAFDRLRLRLGSSPFAKGVALLAGGTGLGHAVTMLGSPLLARLYGPRAFGGLQIYLSLIMILGVVSALRYEMAILLPENEEQGFNVAILCLSIAMAVTGTCFVVMGGLWWAGFLPVILKPLGVAAWLIPAGAFLSLIYQVLTYWAIRQSSFRVVGLSKVTQATTQLGTQVVLGVESVSHAGLIVGDCVGRIGALLPLAKRFLADGVRLRWRWDLGGMKREAHRYRRFPLFSSWGALINALGIAAPSLMLAQHLGAVALGWYGLADRVVGLPSILLGQAISQVYMGEVSRLIHTDPAKVLGLFRKLLGRVALMGLAPTFVIILAGPWLFRLVFGLEWQSAGQIARILALYHYVAFIASPLIPTLTLLERQDFQTAWDIGRLVVILGALVGAKTMGVGVSGTIGLLSAAGALSYLTHIILSYSLLVSRTKKMSHA